MSQRAYKFLAQGALGPITRRAWPTPTPSALDGAPPEPGAWVEADGPVQQCLRGVHACRPDQLAHWLFDELWVVELEGEVVEGYDCVVAPRGRLLRRIDEWSGALGADFAHAVREHALALAQTAAPEAQARVATYLHVSGVLAESGSAVGAGYVAAVAVARLGEASAIEAAYRAERAWQSAWLGGRLERLERSSA